MIKEVYYRSRTMEGTLFEHTYQGILLGEDRVLVFTEEGFVVKRFSKSTGEVDINSSLVFAHLFRVGNPEKTVDVKAVQNMSVVEFFNYLADLSKKKEPLVRCLSR